MSIVPENTYPTKTTPASASYPFGSARNVTISGDGTGTPWEQALVNDIWGFLQKLLTDAGVTPSGVPDTVALSDYFNSMLAIGHKRVETVADLRLLDDSSQFKANTLAVTQGANTVGDGGANAFYWAPASTATDNTGQIVKVASIVTGRWVAVNQAVANGLKFGCYNDGTNSAVNDIAIKATMDASLVWYFPAGTYAHSADIVVPNNKNWEWRGDGYFRTIFEYAGSGVAFKMADQASVRRVGARGFSIRNVGSGTEGLYLIGVQESWFDEVETKDFSVAQTVISTGTQGCFWIKFDKCRLYAADLVTSVGLKLTQEIASSFQVNAVTITACRINGYVTNPGVGILHDHSGGSVKCIGNWFENLHWASETAGFNGAFIGNRFETIDSDSGSVVKFRDDIDATAGTRFAFHGNSSDTGSIQTVNNAGAEYAGILNKVPPFAEGVADDITYSRANADGKDGYIEKTAGGDLELAFDRAEQTQAGFGVGERVRYHFTLEKVVVAGGPVRLQLVGLDSGGGLEALGKLDDATNVPTMDVWLNAGTHTVSFVSPWFEGSGAAVDLAFIKVKAVDVGVGETTTITGAGGIGWETAPSGEMIER